MKNKTISLLAENQPKELLQDNPNASIWEMDVSGKTAIGNLILHLFVYVLTIAVFLISSTHREPIQLAILGIPGVVYTFIYLYYAFMATTTKYTIFPHAIQFEWGPNKVDMTQIPFTKITAINLVGYQDSDESTIYFGASEPFDVKKMDFDEGQDRAHITFEKVKNGEEVYKLLNLL